MQYRLCSLEGKICNCGEGTLHPCLARLIAGYLKAISRASRGKDAKMENFVTEYRQRINIILQTFDSVEELQNWLKGQYH